MPLYTNLEEVKLRLKGKVRFTEDEDDENKMPVSLLTRLVNEAEGQVESDMSPRYAAPFQTDDGEPFCKLPARPTKEIIRTLCELQSVLRVLETDFGSGGAMDGDKYGKKLKERYDEVLKGLLGRKEIGGSETNQWQRPPLPSLKLNFHNTEADDGYSGQVLTTSHDRGDFPAKQINDPSENFWNGEIDE